MSFVPGMAGVAAFMDTSSNTVLTPTTWNPSDKASGTMLSNGNLTAATPSSGGSGVRSIKSVGSRKFYWEIAFNSGIAPGSFGIATSAMPISSGIPGFSADSYGYYGGDGKKYNNSVGVAYGASYGTGDVISVLLDMDGRQLEFWKNGVSQGVAFTGLGAGPFFASIGDGSSSTGINATANFGATPFVYQRPSGYRGGFGNI